MTTAPTDADVTAFLDAVPDERRRAEGHAMRELMERVTGEKAVMWGPTMVGFGSVRYVNATTSGDMFAVGFSPRKGALTIYGVTDGDNALLADLGPHTTGVSCLYLKKLDAVDPIALETLVRLAWEKAALTIDDRAGSSIS